MPDFDYPATLNALLAGEDLGCERMTAAMDAVMEGELTPAQIGALLVALRMKGESVAEISGAAASMRRHATRIDAGEPPVVDTCGTGGDGAGTFNVSTAAAIIAPAAGVKVAKHGNRSVSSKCGSADVLRELGVNIDATPEVVGRCVREVGIGFLFAPKLHGAMKHAVGPRRELGIRSIFNVLGPLSNPAGATAQVMGVFAAELVPVLAKVLQELGAQRAMVVHGLDGLDEITGTTNTRVAELRDGQVSEHEFDPRPCIGDYCRAEELSGGEPAESARHIRDILAGQDGPRSRVARLNAAAAILVADRAPDFAAAYVRAGEVIADGTAAAKLQALAAASHRA